MSREFGLVQGYFTLGGLRTPTLKEQFGGPIKAVIDTCVILDALGRNDKQPAEETSRLRFNALAAIGFILTQGKLFNSVDCHKEWRERVGAEGLVADQPDGESPQRLIKQLAAQCIFIKPRHALPSQSCRDPQDNKWLLLCEATRAHVLLTRDRGLLSMYKHHTTQIMRPDFFISQVVGCGPKALKGIPVRSAPATQAAVQPA